ncbi:4Fe-4S binding protein [bacterium]|nr:4Fe-4S binding protein [bacterium]
MPEVKIDKNKCKACGLCIPVCPKKILKMGTERNDYGNCYVLCTDETSCIACCLCATMCPDWAITIQDDK